MANPFIINQYLPQETFRVTRGAQLGGIGMSIANKNKAQAREKAMQEEFMTVLESNDPKQVAAFSFKYPEAAKQAQQSFGIANPRTQSIAETAYGKALQSGDEIAAADQLDLYADQVEANGGTPTNMREDAQALRAGLIDMNRLEMGVALTQPELHGRYVKFKESQSQSDAMTPYQQEMIKGNKANRELRRLEIDEKNIDRQIRREINDLKKQELQSKLDDTRAKKTQAKQEDYKRINNAIIDAENKKTTINELLGNDGYLDSLTGYQGRLPSVTDEGVEADAIMDNIKNSMTIENLSVMSGPLTDKDIQVIASASSRLNPGMSKKALKRELRRIDGAYDRVIKNYNKEIMDKGYQQERQSVNVSDMNDVSKLSDDELFN